MSNIDAQAHRLIETQTSDQLMTLVRWGHTYPTGRGETPGRRGGSYAVMRRAAELAGCPHDGGRCTGVLARRGYTGHHNPALYAEKSGS